MSERNPHEWDDGREDPLFEWLAQDEPPLDADHDTAPSRTAPRPAVTVPESSASRAGYRYWVLGGLVLLLLLTTAATIVVFTQEDEPVPDAEADEPVALEDDAEATARPLLVEEASPQAEPVVPTATPQPLPTRQVRAFDPEPLATAAADEIAVALRQPAAPMPEAQLAVERFNPFTISGQRGRTEVVNYTVQAGDTLTSISERFGLDICSLVWSNPRNRVSPLRPGYVLNILPEDGVLYKVERPVTIQQVADETQVDPYEIIEAPYNNLSMYGLTPENELLVGMRVVIPGGDGGNCNVWAAPTGSTASSSGAGSSSMGGVSAGNLWGCSYEVTTPGFPTTLPVAPGSYTFFQGFTPGHSGVDLAGRTGSPVYAAGSGTVAFAGWNDWGYGYAIVIDHGGSYTLYGHLDALGVSCGQVVTAGGFIGSMGSTGRSSGPHLHFEIRDAGFNPQNPVFTIGM